MVDRFEVCWPLVLAQECPDPGNWSDVRNFSDDAHDPGGETMCGVIQREYDVYRKGCGEACRDVRGLTEEEGREIYRVNYWEPHCPELPAGLDLVFFDESVNAGTFQAVKVLQHVVGAKVDGLWGAKTGLLAGTVGAVGGPTVASAVRAFTARRKAVYEQMRGFAYFGRGWLRRCDEIGAAALRMIQAT